jgi:hypothetical protein
MSICSVRLEVGWGGESESQPEREGELGFRCHFQGCCEFQFRLVYFLVPGKECSKLISALELFSCLTQ